MNNCTDCKHAQWDRTMSGRLHPSGAGRCGYEYQVPPLPASWYWTLGGAPRPAGGYINRHQELSEHCTYFAWEDNKP